MHPGLTCSCRLVRPFKPTRASAAEPPDAIYRAAFVGSPQRHRSADASRYIDLENAIGRLPAIEAFVRDGPFAVVLTEPHRRRESLLHVCGLNCSTGSTQDEQLNRFICCVETDTHLSRILYKGFLG